MQELRQSRKAVADQLCAVPEHPLASAVQTSLAELSSETFVDFPATSPGRAQSDEAFAGAGLNRTVAYEIGVAELMIRLVARDLGVGLLGSEFAARFPEVVSIPLADGPYRIEYLAWSEFNPSPAARAFLAAIG